MTGLLDPENTLDPCNYFVRAWIGGLVQADETRLNKSFYQVIYNGYEKKKENKIGLKL